jgi:membrane protein implicated in regulation of membrane protease activity
MEILAIKVAQVFLALLAVSLIYFALTPGQSLLDMVKYFALSLGLSIAFLLLYPRLRQVRKGDQVTITGSMPMPFASLLGFTAVALSDAQLGGEVRVRINGREAFGIVESYEGLLSPPRIRIVFEEMVK